MGIRTTAGVVALVVLAGLTAGAATPQAAPLGAAPGCPIFPADNVWNDDVSALPVATNSATLLQTIGLTAGLHPDFGSYAGYGIPFNTVPGTQPKLKVRFATPRSQTPAPIRSLPSPRSRPRATTTC